MSGASDRDFALEIAGRLERRLLVQITRFFGGAGLTQGRLQFGFVIDGALYFRIDESSRHAYEDDGASPFTYVARGKTVTVASYYEVPAGVIDDVDRLAEWACQAVAVAKASKPPASKRMRRT